MTGTTLDAHIAQAVIENGESHTGKFDILGMYCGAYEPLKDLLGNIAGVLFAGLPASEANAAQGICAPVCAGTRGGRAGADVAGIVLLCKRRTSGGLWRA